MIMNKLINCKILVLNKLISIYWYWRAKKAKHGKGKIRCQIKIRRKPAVDFRKRFNTDNKLE